MGRKTYEQVLTFGEFPYLEKERYVFSTDPHFNAAPHAQTVRTDIKASVEALHQEGEHIWLVGGAALIHPFIEWGLLDELLLSIHPILLGDGVPLFNKTKLLTPLTLIKNQSYDSGLIQLIYQVRKQND